MNNHAFTIAFSLETHAAGPDVTARELRTALQNRLADLDDDELIEAIGLPFDSYEVPQEQKYIATIHLLINATSEAEACNTVSTLLTENGMQPSHGQEPSLTDWAYTKKNGAYTAPRAVQTPIPYDSDELDLQSLTPPRLDKPQGEGYL